MGLLLAAIVVALIGYVLWRANGLEPVPEATAHCKDVRSELACSTCCGSYASVWSSSPAGRSCKCVARPR